MLYRAKRVFSPVSSYHTHKLEKPQNRSKTHTNDNWKQTDIWQCWQTSKKSTVGRFHSTPSEPRRSCALRNRTAKNRKTEPIGYWMINYLFIELLETSGKKLKNWVKNIVKTTSVINKNKCNKTFKGWFSFKWKNNTNTRNDGTTQQQMTTFFPPRG